MCSSLSVTQICTCILVCSYLLTLVSIAPVFVRVAVALSTVCGRALYALCETVWVGNPNDCAPKPLDLQCTRSLSPRANVRCVRVQVQSTARLIMYYKLFSWLFYIGIM